MRRGRGDHVRVRGRWLHDHNGVVRPWVEVKGHQRLQHTVAVGAVGIQRLVRAFLHSDAGPVNQLQEGCGQRCLRRGCLAGLALVPGQGSTLIKVHRQCHCGAFPPRHRQQALPLALGQGSYKGAAHIGTEVEALHKDGEV